MKPRELINDAGPEGLINAGIVRRPAVVNLPLTMDRFDVLIAPDDRPMERRVRLVDSSSTVRAHPNAPDFVSSKSLEQLFSPVGASVAHWGRVAKVVARWRGLTDDWDGDDAVAPTQAQLDAAEAFMGAAGRQGVREPRPYIAPDGEVGFHWDGRAKASVSFLPSRFLAFCPRVNKEPVRVVGPLDLAPCSRTLFEALAAVR